MRLHQLRIQAFGPFAGAEHIDFDALGAGGLHLIHGPTGAGKTSILDAICFALFSGVPGSRMQGRDTLRSDHADPASRPEVELEFSVGQRRLRVCRSPEHQVPKKRGTGMRAQRGSVHLEELCSGRWRTLSTRADEVGQTIGDLLGMGLPQFAQVMLLPQGEFTAFLRAKADDRGKLLERLFDIGDFAAVEQWLTDHRKDLESQVQAAAAQRCALISRARDALGGLPGDDEPTEAALPTLDAGDTASTLRDLTARLSDRLTGALAEADAAATHVDQLRTRLADLRALAGLQGQARSAQQTLDRLAADEPSITAAARRLDRARRAELCRPAITALSRRQSAHDQARRLAENARTAMADATSWPVPEPHGPDGLTDVALQPLVERGAAGTAALAGQPELLRHLHSVEDALRRSRTERDAAAAEADHCERQLADISARHTQLNTRRASLLPDALAHRSWRGLLTDLDAALRAARTAAGDLDAVVTSAELHQQARREWVDAEQEVLRLRSARLAGIAAELASELLDGRPCPVCGSPDHPAAAEPAPDQIDADQVVAAERIQQDLAQRAQHAAARWSSMVGRAQTTCAALADTIARLESAPKEDAVEDVTRRRVSISSTVADHDAAVRAARDGLALDEPAVDPACAAAVRALTAVLGTAHADVTKDADRAASAADQVAALDERLASAEAEQLAAEQAAAAAAQSCRAADARLEALEAQLATARSRLDELGDDHRVSCGCTDGSDPAAAHAAAARQLDDLIAAATTQCSAAAELRTALDEVGQALAEHGFADLDAARQAMLDGTEQQRLRTTVEAARTEQAKAAGVLEQRDVAAAAAAEPADVEGAQAALAIGERAARHTHDAVGDLRRAVQSLDHITAEIAAYDAQLAPLREQLAVATGLSAAVSGSGDNVMRMRLTAYVLAARLETVTALANERLEVMTAGRYQLEHSDARAGRGGKSGLGLRVRDAWTGTTRDTTTLSGGESFVASLALALGLGDAVLQAAGGRRLETLLVDEGFGSLDEESLEQVLDVLDGLRAGGRTVGIVSHVPELRTRIPAQIRVRKTITGSTLEVQHATEVA